MTDDLRNDVETARQAISRVSDAINGAPSTEAQHQDSHQVARVVTTYKVRLAVAGVDDNRYTGLLLRTRMGGHVWWEWQLVCGTEVAPKLTCKYTIAHDAKTALLHAWGHRLCIECLDYGHQKVDVPNQSVQT